MIVLSFLIIPLAALGRMKAKACQFFRRNVAFTIVPAHTRFQTKEDFAENLSKRLSSGLQRKPFGIAVLLD